MAQVRNWNRRIILGGTLGVLTLAAGCTRPKTTRIALVMKSLANEFFKTMQAGAIAHQQAHASQYQLISNGIRDEGDTAGQIALVEQMIAQHVDAIVLAPADSKALVPVVKAALDKNIPVFNIDNKLDADALAAKGAHVPFIGPDNRTGAALAGGYLAKKLQAGNQVAIIEGVPTTVNAQQRTLGFKDAMTGARMTVVSVQSGEWEIDKANVIASAMLRQYPELTALLCGNDSMALGAASAVTSAGKAGKVLIAGFDNISAVKALLADGRISCTIDQAPGAIATTAIDAAVSVISKKVAYSDIPSNTPTSVQLVTA